MSELDTQGKRHAKLQAELDEVRARLAPLIRAEKTAGATFVELTVRSGYKSVETVRQIVHPKARVDINKRRRAATEPDA